MKKASLLLLALVALHSFAQLEDVLESKLSSIVTVAVYESSDMNRVFGYGRDIDHSTHTAYKNNLNLSGAESTGSGFVITHNLKKYVITNAHVIADATDADGSIACFSIHRKKYNMKLVGADSFYDIAILSFDDSPGEEISSISFAENDVRIGNKVFAIGNPLRKYPYTVTDGIVSAMNRTLEGFTAKYGYIQHTATVSWGNSGGPLINNNGEVVGINTRIEISEFGFTQVIHQQINFALDGQIAKRLISDMMVNDGRVRRAYFGLIFEKENSPYSQYVADKQESIILAETIDGFPGAQHMKDHTGKQLKSINGKPINNLQDILAQLEIVAPGESVDFGFENGNVSVQGSELGIDELKISSNAFYKKYVGKELIEEEGSVWLKSSEGKSKDEDESTDNWEEEYEKAWEEVAYLYEDLSEEDRAEKKEELKWTYLLYSILGDDDEESDLASITELHIKGIATEDDYGNGGKWMTRTAHEMGAALRIASLSGNITLIEDNEDDYGDFETYEVNLLNEDGNQVQVLLY